MNAPLFDWNAWWAGLCVIGLGSLAGAALPPWGRGRARPIGWAARTAAGLVAIAAIVLGAGQVQGFLFHRWFWSVGGAAGWAVAFVRAWQCVRSMRRPSIFGLEKSIFAIGWLAVACWIAVMLGPAFSPPVNYDVLEYHQGIIPHVFERGRFEPIPGIVYTRQPIATEALYTLAAAIEGDAWGFAPGILHWSMIVLGTAVIARLLKRVAMPASSRPWIVLALLTQPIVYRLQLDRLTDWTGVMLLAAGLVALRSRGGLGAAALAGMIAGGALGVKWTNAGTVALPLALMIVVHRGSWSVNRERVARVLVFSLAAVLIWLPWGAWSWHYARNPFSPFMARWFPTDFWPPARLDFLVQTHGPLAPFQWDYWTNLVSRLGRGLSGASWIAVALFFAAGAALLKWFRANGKNRNGGRIAFASWLALGLLGSALMWGALRHAADRFLAPSILLAILIAAILARALVTAPSRRATAFLFAIVVVLGVRVTPDHKDRVSALVRYTGMRLSGSVTADEYSQIILGDTAPLFEAANALPEGSRLIAINEARRYPFRRPIALASVFDRSPAEPAVRGATDADTIRKRLIAAGYTHILVNENEQARILAMHTPPGLIGNRELQAMIERNDQAAMVERFAGATEFSVEPLNATELRAWKEFLNLMRARATWKSGARPAMYISKL